jgi:hypothetical protein
MRIDDPRTQVSAVGSQGLRVACRGSCDPEEQRRIGERGVRLPLVAAFAGHCPALRNGRCSVYEVRPMVCRLWGAVEGMKWPFGCAPVLGYLSDATGHRLLRQVMIGSRAAEGGG